jgi:ribose transport system ATP-binding protein
VDASSREPILRIRRLAKAYAAPVLDDVDLELLSGEVHALMGANGAGKSTLARIIGGLTLPDAGTIDLGGKPYRPLRRKEAEDRGVQLVPQEPDLLPTLSVAENVLLGRWPARMGIIDQRRLNDEASRALAAVGLEGVDPATPTERLGVGQRHLVAIAAALSRSCRVLILDEPTAALTRPQVDQLFDQVARLRDEGVAIVFVSHRHEELLRIADRISVLRDGRLVATRCAKEFALEDAVRLMIGEQTAAGLAFESRGETRETAPSGTTRSLALRVSGLCCGRRVHDVSFALHRGEILGLAGLVGSGRTEVLRAVFGAEAADAGAVFVGDEPSPRRFQHPGEAVRAGLGMVPEDRKREGLLLPLAVTANVTLARLGRFGGRFGRIDHRAEHETAEELASRVALRARSVEQPVQELSGGNQQKVVLARWLLDEPDVLLLDEPTRGVDIAAKFAIHTLIASLAQRGRAVLLVSSEIEELMTLCDRITVISAGRLVATFERATWTHEAILAAAFHAYSGPGAARES